VERRCNDLGVLVRRRDGGHRKTGDTSGHQRLEKNSSMDYNGSWLFETTLMARLLMQTKKGIKEYRLGRNPITVGRLPANTLEFKNDERMSRRHFMIKSVPDGYLLIDLDSVNGTYVNAKRVTEHLLKDGDKIQAGQTLFVFRED